MQTYKVKFPSGSQYFIHHTFVIAKATAYIIITPCVVIKIGTIGLRKSMQVDNFPLFIFQITSLYM